MEKDRRHYLVKLAKEDFVDRKRALLSTGVGVGVAGAGVKTWNHVIKDVSSKVLGQARSLSAGRQLAYTAGAAVPLAAAAYGGLSAWDRYKRRDL